MPMNVAMQPSTMPGPRPMTIAMQPSTRAGPRPPMGPQPYPFAAGGKPGLGGYPGGLGRAWWWGRGRYGYGTYNPAFYDTDAIDAGDPGIQPRRRRRSFVINWNDPVPLDQALNHPGAGVFIVERAGAGVAAGPSPVASDDPADAGMPDADMSAGPADSPDAGEPPPDGEPPPEGPEEQELADGDWQPTNLGYAIEGLGSRLGHLMEDIGGLQGPTDQYRVRLGVLRIRPQHPVDRAVLRAVAHRIAGRLGVGAGPTPQERRILGGTRIWHRGVLPEYLGGSNGQAQWSGGERYRRRFGGVGPGRAWLRSQPMRRVRF
jgi:hypothetical protein